MITYPIEDQLATVSIDRPLASTLDLDARPLVQVLVLPAPGGVAGTASDRTVTETDNLMDASWEDAEWQ